jgi:hypothetical protein
MSCHLQDNAAKSLVANEKFLGPEHPATATTLDNLGSLLRSQYDFARAYPLYERALDKDNSSMLSFGSP